MIKEFKHYTKNINESCDVCVIGSGAGGAVVARELAEKGHSVILLEEGGNYTVDDWTGKPLAEFSKMYRNGATTGTLGRNFISLTMGKCIGGTTTINSATCFRPPESTYKKWLLELGLDQLTPETLEDCFCRVEKEINVTELSWEVLGNFAKVLKTGADKLGLNCKPLKHNVKDCKGCGTCQFGCPEGAKQSMDITYIPKAIEYGAKVYANCRADKLIKNENEVEGVSCSLINPETGKADYSMKIRAKIVVVACGTMITPSFLKRNGLKNKNIGRHLQIHPAAKAVAFMDQKVEGWKGVSQGAYIDDFEGEGIMLEGAFTTPGLLLAAVPYIGKKHKEIATSYPHVAPFGIMVHDTSKGRVLKSSPKNINAVYNISKHDVEKLKRGIAYTARILFEAGANVVFTGISKMPVLNSVDDVNKLFALKVKANQIETFAFHPVGTCRMSATSDSGAVNQWGEAFEMKNLYVADGSVVPTSLGVNPQLTIMCLATRIAQGISQKLG